MYINSILFRPLKLLKIRRTLKILIVNKNVSNFLARDCTIIANTIFEANHERNDTNDTHIETYQFNRNIPTK